MDITCISDLHGHFPQLEGGDLLIIAGDLTSIDTPEEWARYFLWQGDLPYKKIIFIAGNHDNRLQNVDMAFYSPEHKVCYLCDSGTEFDYFDDRFPEEDTKFLPNGHRKLKIWGSPWTLIFPGINPKCTAFTGDEELLASKFALIPDDIDILVTHGPPYQILDQTKRGEKVGSIELLAHLNRIRPRLHIYGHIHEDYGQLKETDTLFINCSYVNERYQPVNKPIRIIL